MSGSRTEDDNENIDSIIGTTEHKAPEDLLDAFHKSASNSNLLEYFGCFSSQGGRFLGTDKAEAWSVNEFYEYARPVFESKQGWTYIPKSRRIDYFLDGNPMCTFDELLEARPSTSMKISTVRGTGCLIKEKKHDNDSEHDSFWFIASYHLTFPVPNECVEDVCRTILKAEHDADAEKADQAAADLLAELGLEADAANAISSKAVRSNNKKSKKKKKKKLGEDRKE